MILARRCTQTGDVRRKREMLVKCALAALAIGSVLCGVCGGGPPAHATLVEISGSGTWSASTPTTPESAPGESFSYSFDIPNPYTGTAFPPPPPLNEVYRQPSK